MDGRTGGWTGGAEKEREREKRGSAGPRARQGNCYRGRSGECCCTQLYMATAAAALALIERVEPY